MQFLNPSKWYYHPVFIFACSIFALAFFLILTVHWYMEITTALETVVKKFHIDPGLILPTKTGMIMLVLVLLLAVVLAGILLAFIYYQKTVTLFRLQHNFIYNFTHELKTPVTSLKIYLETFIRHDLEKRDIIKYSEYMLEDIWKLNQNINSILNLAKMESKSYGAELTNEDLPALTEKLCRKNSTILRSCRIDIDNPDDEPFVCPVNVFLFEMLLMNIVSNAIKYNDSGQPHVLIKFRHFKYKLLVDFIDNGIGIEKQEIRKIFRKFYQAERTEKSEVKGTGLGLYLVFNIARVHGWKVSARSDGPGKGTVFTLSIPKVDLENLKVNDLWKMLRKSVSWS